MGLPPNSRNFSANTARLWRRGGYIFTGVDRRDWGYTLWRLDSAGTWTSQDMAVTGGTPSHPTMVTASPRNADSHRSNAIGMTWDNHLVVTGGQHTDPLALYRSNSPYSITGWSPMTCNITPSGDDLVTYVNFGAFPDGELWMCFSQQDYGLGADSGRDTVFMKLPVGATTWQYVITTGTGDFMVSTGSEPAEAGWTATPGYRRAYARQFYIDPITERVHVTGVWRIGKQVGNTNIHQNDCFYVYSDDRGTTWKNASGTTVTMPLLYANIDSAGFRLPVDMTTPDTGKVVIIGDIRSYGSTVWITYQLNNVYYLAKLVGGTWTTTTLDGSGYISLCIGKGGELRTIQPVKGTINKFRFYYRDEARNTDLIPIGEDLTLPGSQYTDNAHGPKPPNDGQDPYAGLVMIPDEDTPTLFRVHPTRRSIV